MASKKIKNVGYEKSRTYLLCIFIVKKFFWCKLYPRKSRKVKNKKKVHRIDEKTLLQR